MDTSNFVCASKVGKKRKKRKSCSLEARRKDHLINPEKCLLVRQQDRLARADCDLRALGFVTTKITHISWPSHENSVKKALERGGAGGGI